MSKAAKKSILFTLITLMLIAFAMWIRYACRSYLDHLGWVILRSGIYIFLFGAWGYSVHKRIVQVQARHYLLAISALMVLWMTLRSVKFSVNNTDLGRWLWYFYYLPMLFIPLFAVFVSLSLNKTDDFRLPDWTKFLYIPPVFLLFFVLTNDIHQMVFSFPSGILTDRNYSYGSVYFFILCWEIICALLSFIIMTIKCRIPHSRYFRLLPLMPIVLSFLYALAYANGNHFVWLLAGDMTVTQCLLFILILESCIRCGLIQSNLGYEELLEATSLPVQITDTDFSTRHVSTAMHKPLTPGELEQMNSDTVLLDKDTLLKRHRLRSGWVFWKEDISRLNKLQKELELTQDELRDTGDVLTAENAQRARLLKLKEENHLYDVMEEQTAENIAMLRYRLDELRKTGDIANGRRLLGQIIIIGTYIKRRNNLIFVAAQHGFISAHELRLCLNESVENLLLYGVECKAIVNGEARLDIECATKCYDLFEAVAEADPDSLNSLLIYINADKDIKLNICVSVDKPLNKLKERFPEIEWEQDEDGLQYIRWKA